MFWARVLAEIDFAGIFCPASIPTRYSRTLLPMLALFADLFHDEGVIQSWKLKR